VIKNEHFTVLSVEPHNISLPTRVNDYKNNKWSE